MTKAELAKIIVEKLTGLTIDAPTDDATTKADTKIATPDAPPSDDGTKITKEQINAAVEAAIKEHMPDTGAPSSGNGALTFEQVKGMSVEQINANWTQVQAALASQPPQ